MHKRRRPDGHESGDDSPHDEDLENERLNNTCHTPEQEEDDPDSDASREENVETTEAIRTAYIVDMHNSLNRSIQWLTQMYGVPKREIVFVCRNWAQTRGSLWFQQSKMVDDVVGIYKSAALFKHPTYECFAVDGRDEDQVIRCLRRTTMECPLADLLGDIRDRRLGFALLDPDSILCTFLVPVLCQLVVTYLLPKNACEWVGNAPLVPT